MADEVASDQNARLLSKRRRIGKWVLAGAGAVLLLLIAAAALLNTSLGERFLADRIAAQTLPNGLNIRIGRIEGNLYGAAVLHDVTLSDPQGVFMTIPRAEVDWNPGAWVSYKLDVDSFTASRARLERLPEFLPSEEDGPILPGFDIAIDELEIEQLVLGERVTGDREESVDLSAQVLVEDRRLFFNGKGTVGEDDRFALDLDAEPDGDVFDLDLDYRTAPGGAVARMLGAEAGYRARIVGDGTWREWNGNLLIRRNDERFAAFKLTNRAGVFGITGQANPMPATQGLVRDILGETVSLDARVRIEGRRLDGRYALVTRGVFARGRGGVDLAENLFDDLALRAEVRDPDAFGGTFRLRDAVLDALLDGPMRRLGVEHTLAIGELAIGSTTLTDIQQSSTATYDGTVWNLPLDARVERVETGSDMLDPRLMRGRLSGMLILDGDDLRSDNLRIAFPATEADLALRGDVARGLYGISGDVRARQLALENIGVANGSARIDFTLGQSWSLRSDIDARLAPVTNDTLANLAGDVILVRGPVALGPAAPVTFNSLRIGASKLSARLSGRIVNGQTVLSGKGSHNDYGPFTVEAQIDESGPTATLVLADPLPAAGLQNVRLALSPSEDGFRVETDGQSLLGPFDGVLGIVAPRDGPTQIAVERLTVTDTLMRGGLVLANDGIEGELTLVGGGTAGIITLDPKAQGQGIDASIEANNASFGGDVPLRIARASIDVQGVIAEGETDFTGEASGRGLSYGSLFIGRFAAEVALRNGVGAVNASLAGRRGGSFRLDLTSQIEPGRITAAAQGEFAGRRISMPRRAVLTRTEGDGWRLQRSQINFGDGGMIVAGQFGGASTAVDLRLADMPLSLADIAVAELGLGGTISGQIAYQALPGAPPSGVARVKIDDLTRSGLVLSSRPVDIALVGDLGADQLLLRARFQNAEIERGQLRARIASLPADGALWDRLRAGRLSAGLRYEGAAESLWRLAAVDAFDLTGPVAISADASGSIADPRVRGTVRSDNLRVRSSLSGTDIQQVKARGRFAGSLLRLTSFSGTTPGGGSVSGSGTVDLAGLGERVQGRFLEIRGPRLDLRAAATNARLLDGNGLSATVTGPLRIISDGLGGTIAGRVRIDRASWSLGTAADDMSLPRIATREINAPDDRAPRAAAGRPWRYLIDAKGSSRIDVDGLGLDSEWGADIILRGTTDDPRIGGEANVVRGFYSFAGTRFELTRGRIRFDENVPIDPRLDVRAETRQNGIEVTVRVTGNAQQPEISFTSDPALPEEEILAQLLFGGSITNLSATDALQLGAALASLRGGGGLDPINELRSAIGLDRLRIVGADPALDRGTAVALGKNIGRRFYVELITDGRGYSATEAEFRITSWLSLLGAVSTIGRNSVVIEARRNY